MVNGSSDYARRMNEANTRITGCVIEGELYEMMVEVAGGEGKILNKWMTRLWAETVNAAGLLNEDGTPKVYELKDKQSQAAQIAALKERLAAFEAAAAAQSKLEKDEIKKVS